MEPEQGEGNGAVPLLSKTSTCLSVSLQISLDPVFSLTTHNYLSLNDRRQHKLRTQR